MKKLLLFALLFSTMPLMFVGCSNNSGRISGSDLFHFDNVSKIAVSVGGEEKVVAESGRIVKIEKLFNELKLQKTNTAEKEGGMSVTFESATEKASIVLCGKQIEYQGNLYETDTDVASSIKSIIA